MAKKDPIRTRILLREYLESLIVAVLLALVIRFFVISAYKIPTGSMVPTLKVGDFIFSYRLPYGVPIPFSGGKRISMELPKRGDVVVFRYPENPRVNYVKRVIGLPGDRIEIKNHELYINEVKSEYEIKTPDLIADLPSNELYDVYEEKIGTTSHLVLRSKSDEADFFGPMVVPPGEVFVLGDNRDTSDDSRYWGSVPVRNLDGKVIMIWMSFDWNSRWGDDRFPSVRTERLFKSVK